MVQEPRFLAGLSTDGHHFAFDNRLGRRVLVHAQGHLHFASFPLCQRANETHERIFIQLASGRSRNKRGMFGDVTG